MGEEGGGVEVARHFNALLQYVYSKLYSREGGERDKAIGGRKMGVVLQLRTLLHV